MGKLGVAALAVLTITSAVAQERRIYIAPDDHTDYMWTGDEETYRRSFVRMLDYYLDQADKTAREPSAFQGRWHADGSFWLRTYEQEKTPAEFARLIARVKDGHISFPMNALVSTYGGTPTEAVLRGMYYAGSLERRFDVKIPLAIAMEDQTMPYGLGALWAGAGAKYSWKGICGCATKITQYGVRPHDIYWWKGDDGSRILMKWNALTPGRNLMGTYLEARDLTKAIHHVETDPAFLKAYPYNVIGVFGKGGDDLETYTDQFPIVARRETTSNRKVIVSNMVDFFQDFEKTYGATLPEWSGSFGNEWDMYTASVSEVAARVRRAVEKLRGAEALASLVISKQPHFMDSRKQARDDAWMALGIFWEHDWTADGPIARADRVRWGKKVAGQVEDYVDRLHSDAADALGSMIATAGTNRRFYVFNPLGWTRTSVADIAWSSAEPVHIVDVSTGQEVTSQIVWTAGQRWLRILASGLPAVGYRVYEIRNGAAQAFSPAASVNGNVMESSQYIVKLDGNGAVRSLVDKGQKNREFAGRALNDFGPEQGSVEVENAGPVSVTLKAHSDGPLTHTTRVTLTRDERAIDIRNEIEQNFDGTHTWSFRFNLTNPDVWHEEVGAVIRARLLGEGGHYSPTMSRLDWLTLNHFVDMSGADKAGVTLSSSDLAFMKLGTSSIVDGVSNLDVNTPQISVLAGGQVDGSSLGIHKQGGDSYFLQRFALTTHSGYSAPQAMRFALEHQNPPITGWLREGGTYAQSEYSMLSSTNPNVLLWALKPAEDGALGNLIARFWNLSSTQEEYSVSLKQKIVNATAATHVETDRAPLEVKNGAVSMRAAKSQIQTIRLEPGPCCSN